MEKINPGQLELFTEHRQAPQAKSDRAKPRKGFFSPAWNYEKMIISFFAAVLVSVVSFSLGVEHGKRVSLARSNLRFDLSSRIKTPEAAMIASRKKQAPAGDHVISQQEEPKSVLYAPTTAVLTAEKPGREATPDDKDLAAKYTIQLASFKTRENAKKAAQMLRKKGFDPIILSKGSYTVLCVGNFSNKNSAQSKVADFKKQYQTCYVRRL